MTANKYMMTMTWSLHVVLTSDARFRFRNQNQFRNDSIFCSNQNRNQEYQNRVESVLEPDFWVNLESKLESHMGRNPASLVLTIPRVCMLSTYQDEAMELWENNSKSTFFCSLPQQIKNAVHERAILASQYGSPKFLNNIHFRSGKEIVKNKFLWFPLSIVLQIDYQFYFRKCEILILEYSNANCMENIF